MESIYFHLFITLHIAIWRILLVINSAIDKDDGKYL